jgi:hypothetical protein
MVIAETADELEWSMDVDVDIVMVSTSYCISLPLIDQA